MCGKIITANAFTVVPCDGKLLADARALDFTDFEDAVVAMAAKKARCKYIVTRNPRDFANSPVPALTPGEFLALIISKTWSCAVGRFFDWALRDAPPPGYQPHKDDTDETQNGDS